MTRRILLVPLLAVTLVGFVKGQGGSKKEEADAAVKEATKKEALNFYQEMDKAIFSRDRKAMDPYFADDFTFTKSIDGRGEVLNKAQWLDLRTSPGTGPAGSDTVKWDHDAVKLYVFGDTVVMSGHSRSVIYYRGEISKGPRLFTLVLVKEHGRWQAVTWQIADIPNGPY